MLWKEKYRRKMEQQQQQGEQESGNNNNNNKGGGMGCRQTSTRWTPTTDQIRILKDLYYNSGVRSPTADQIQKISARLRQYGKIEGKNVFYWFQNHKARERQKKRFNATPSPSPTSTVPSSLATDHHHHLNHHHHGIPMQRPSSGYLHNHDAVTAITPAGKFDQDHLFHNRYSSFSNGNYYHASSASDCALIASNGFMSGHSYGSMDCSISPTGGSSGFNGGGNMSYNWINHSSPPYNFFNRPKSLFCPEGDQDEDDEEEDDYDDDDDDGDSYLQNRRRTLPLFPMHGEDHHHINGGGFWKAGQSDGERRGHVVRGHPCASLDLTLSSCTGVPPD